MKRKLIAVTLMAVSLCGLSAPIPVLAKDAQTQAIVDPAQHLTELTKHIRNNDLANLMRVSMPAGQFQMLRGAYEMQRGKPITDEERAEFEEAISKLTAPNAVDTLMAEIEPKLREAAPQAEGGILMAIGAMQMAAASPDSDLTPEQRDMIRTLTPGVERWLKSTDFFNPAIAREAVTLVTRAAQDTGVQNLDQLKMLSFEEALGAAAKVMAASKRALRLYGLDVDAIASSARFQTLSVDGDVATVRATVTIFDAPLSHNIELRQIEGRWYGKDAVIRFQSDHDYDTKREAIRIEAKRSMEKQSG
jgi:hypothetical protein